MQMSVREDWLAAVREAPLNPQRRIIDAHCHFFASSSEYPRYNLVDLWTDAAPHKVESIVHVECREAYRKGGPHPLRVVGETDWVQGIASEASRRPGATQVRAIVGAAELRLGARVRPVLEAHCGASKLFRGIRQIAAWDDCQDLFSMDKAAGANLYGDPAFREGFGVLQSMGLVFDAYHYFHQTPYLTALARAFPATQIVLDHLGTPLGIGPYAGRRETICKQWRRDLSDLASCSNVTVKLGGMAVPWTGFAFDQLSKPPTSDQIVAAQADYYLFAIDAFGPDRCMFESNFPVEKCSVSYTVLWNAFHKIGRRFSEADQDHMFRGTAARVYRMET